MYNDISLKLKSFKCNTIPHSPLFGPDPADFRPTFREMT
jgi:hypothetical protein